VGFLLGWIIQKRWLTLAAFLLLPAGAIILPRLPAPISYLWVLYPALLVTAVVYEGPARLTGMSSRLRLVLALWMGFSTFVLTLGIIASDSIQGLLIPAVATFVVLALGGMSVVLAISGRQIRRDTSTGSVVDSTPNAAADHDRVAVDRDRLGGA
jgi:hypothetical protein